MNKLVPKEREDLKEYWDLTWKYIGVYEGLLSLVIRDLCEQLQVIGPTIIWDPLSITLFKLNLAILNQLGLTIDQCKNWFPTNKIGWK